MYINVSIIYVYMKYYSAIPGTIAAGVILLLQGIYSFDA